MFVCLNITALSDLKVTCCDELKTFSNQCSLLRFLLTENAQQTVADAKYHVIVNT